MQFSGLDESTGAIVDQPGPGVKHVSGYPFLDNHAINLVRFHVHDSDVAYVLPKYFPVSMHEHND